MNIVGLGRAGCAIADCFAQYPQYKVFKIDVDISGERCYNVSKQSGPEAYEQEAPNFSPFFGDIEGETIFIIGGSGYVSAMSLRILEQLRSKCIVDVLYIRPDVELIGGTKRLHEKVTYNVLQQYARSGAINRLYLVSNPEVENTMGSVPVMGYFDALNDFIVSTIHMINVFNNSDPVMGSASEPVETRRICTLGTYDMEKDEEKMFFPLDSVREMRYIYAVSEKVLREDGGLHKKITTQMKGKTTEEMTDISFGVYPTNYDSDYGYLLAFSPNIQN